MKALRLTISIAVCFLLDSAVFPLFNFFGFRPYAMLALTVSIGIFMGQKTAAIIGGAFGLLFDIMFNSIIGLTAISYIVAGMLGGFFYQKYYADNVIVPAVAASVCSFLHMSLVSLGALLSGAVFSSYITVMITYILPCVLLTAGVCVLLHIILRRGMKEQSSVTKVVQEMTGGNER